VQRRARQLPPPHAWPPPTHSGSTPRLTPPSCEEQTRGSGPR
jgi:hypothetical protein